MKPARLKGQLVVYSSYFGSNLSVPVGVITYVKHF